jgi:hypothetical protein
VAVLVGDFVGDSLPDLAVGHRDGSVTFLQGTPGGHFLARPDLTVTGLGTITGLAAGTLDGDSDNEIAVSSSSGVTVLNNHHQSPAVPISNGNFATGLSGWTASGPVIASNGVAQLQESSTTLLTSLQQSFVVPARPQSLSFDLVALGLEDPAGGLPDAFEASLLDAAQNSVVPTFRAEATSFFNANPGGAVSTAQGVTFDGRHVTLDISHLTPGTTVTPNFDLVGNPPGVGSTASIGDVQVSQQAVAETFTATSLPGPFGSPAGIAVADVDGDGHADVVVTDAALNQLLVFNGDGSGNFTRSTLDLSGYGTGAGALAAAPLTAGDNIADVALALSRSNQLLSPLVYDTTPPQATVVNPAAGQILNVSISQIVVQFSEPVRDTGPSGAHSASNPASYTLFDVTTGQPVNIASVSYNPATLQAVLQVAAGSAPLADGNYQVTVKGADPSNSIQDLAGNPLAGGQDVSSTFTIETAAPVVQGLSFSPNILWPPNHKFVTVTATLNLSDPLDPHPSVTLVSITSNEGNIADEVQNAQFGTDDRTFDLLSEREGTGTGRVYTITYLVRNAAGNGRLVAGYVVVPHDQGQENGQWLLSTLPDPTPPGTSSLVTSTVTAINNNTLQVGTPVSGNIAQAGQVDVWSFQGSAGQQLFFNALSGSATVLHWALSDAAGNVLFSSSFQDHDTLTLGASGTYYLTVDARSGGTSPYQMEVWNVPAPSTTAITLGQEVNGSLNVPGQ